MVKLAAPPCLITPGLSDPTSRSGLGNLDTGAIIRNIQLVKINVQQKVASVLVCAFYYGVCNPRYHLFLSDCPEI